MFEADVPVLALSGERPYHMTRHACRASAPIGAAMLRCPILCPVLTILLTYCGALLQQPGSDTSLTHPKPSCKS